MKIAIKKYQVILFFASITIWSVIIVKLLHLTLEEDDYSKINDEIEVPFSSNLADSVLVDTFIAKTIIRDPFLFKSGNYSPTTKKPTEQNKSTKKINPNLLKQFIVSGIIINKNQKTVILNNTRTKETFFLKEGESIEEIKVIEISLNRVKLKAGDEIKEIIVYENNLLPQL